MRAKAAFFALGNCLLFGLFGCSTTKSNAPATALAPQRRVIDEPERMRLEREANAGSADAAFRLFLFYELLLNDRAQAKTWLRKAAENKHVIAQYNIGSILITEPDPQSRAEGIAWLEKSAASGDKEARWLLDRYGLSK